MSMLVSDEHRFTTYEGIAHSVEDLRRRYVNSILEVYDSISEKLLIYMPIQIVDGMMAGHVWTNGKWGDPHNLYTTSTYIQREYPRNGLVQVGKNIYLVSRNSRRQWRRGANDATLSIEKMYSDPDKKAKPDEMVICASAFLQKYMTPKEFVEHLREGDITVPKVITDRVWMLSRDNYLVSLFFEDIFVGMCDRQLKYIPCKESFTLVEETLYEYGLQQI